MRTGAGKVGGPIFAVMRLYWPKEAALNGSWKPPAVRRSK
jgi:hypothetical protein